MAERLKARRAGAQSGQSTVVTDETDRSVGHVTRPLRSSESAAQLPPRRVITANWPKEKEDEEHDDGDDEDFGHHAGDDANDDGDDEDGDVAGAGAPMKQRVNRRRAQPAPSKSRSIFRVSTAHDWANTRPFLLSLTDATKTVAAMLAGTYSPPRASASNGDAGAGDDGEGSLSGDADVGHAPQASTSGGNIGGRKRHAAEALGKPEESTLLGWPCLVCR